jgi:hypothetical protein
VAEGKEWTPLLVLGLVVREMEGPRRRLRMRVLVVVVVGMWEEKLGRKREGGRSGSWVLLELKRSVGLHAVAVVARW